MDFLNQIGSRFMDIRDKTVQKAMDANELRNLRASINDLKKERTEVYGEIGLQYAELHTEDYEPSMEPLMQKLLELNAQLDSLSILVTQVKGIQICPQCGAEVGKDDLFCCRCGTSLQQAEPQPGGFIKCKDCGALVRCGTKFCTQCGSVLSNNEYLEPASLPMMVAISFSAEEKPDEEEPVEAQKEKETYRQESLRNTETVI